MDAVSDELLTIREAAALLSVSAVSLRRWTDSGKLRCLRVGGRRERRFRKTDLLDFMDSSRPPNRSNGSRTSSGTMLAGLPVDYGSHLCSLYETDVGRVKLSVPFLAEGLRRGDVCFLVAGAEAQDQIIADLSEVSGNIATLRSSGQLILSFGDSTGDQMYSFLENEFLKATRGRERGLRVVGDMAWALDRGMEVNELREFETRFDQNLAHAYPVISLCQYDARRFSGIGMLGALKTHRDTFNYPLSRFLGG